MRETTTIPGWTLAERLAWVGRFRRGVVAASDELCELMAGETGKPAWEGLTSDIMPLLAACRWHERKARRLLTPRRLGGRALYQPGQTTIVERAPLGAVAIIATWNYPVQLLGAQLVQAFVAGNAVSVKPSERCPRTQHRLLSIAREAGLAEGALTEWPATREAGEIMIREHDWDHVVFTGSTRVGREIARTLAPRLTPSTLELSGRDSAFVLADADVRIAAASIWNALTMNAGQTCMAPRRVLVERGAAEEFLLALAPFAGGARPVLLIDEQAADRAFSLAREAIDRGARTLAGVLEQPRGPEMRPLALADCPPDASIVAGEHFGPVLPIVAVDSIDEAVAIHGRCDQHLATSVFTRNPWRGRDLATRLGSTSVTINDCVLPTAHPGASIGGRSSSGWGVSGGEAGLLAMTRPVHVSTTSPTLRVPSDTPDPAMASRIASFVKRWYRGVRTPPAPTCVAPFASPASTTPQTSNVAAGPRVTTPTAAADRSPLTIETRPARPASQAADRKSTPQEATP